MSADGKRVVILHVQPRAEAMEDESAELRVIDVATDRVVERIRASADATDRDKVERMNARLDHGTWTPLVEGEVLEHPHGQERDTDERNCDLRAGDLAIHYNDTHLRVMRAGHPVLARGFRAWGHPHRRRGTDRRIEDSGLRMAYTDGDSKLLLVIVTYHRFGDGEIGSDDEEHVVRLR